MCLDIYVCFTCVLLSCFTTSSFREKNERLKRRGLISFPLRTHFMIFIEIIHITHIIRNLHGNILDFLCKCLEKKTKK